jgi:hypothetical protein
VQSRLAVDERVCGSPMGEDGGLVLEELSKLHPRQSRVSPEQRDSTTRNSTPKYGGKATRRSPPDLFAFLRLCHVNGPALLPSVGTAQALHLRLSNRIQSSRRLEREAGRNLEAIWLLRRLTPDDKTIADFRKLMAHWQKPQRNCVPSPIFCILRTCKGRACQQRSGDTP